MFEWLRKINTFFRDILLDDVDKQYDGPLPYHKKFGPKSIKDQKEILEQKRALEREQQSRGI